MYENKFRSSTICASRSGKLWVLSKFVDITVLFWTNEFYERQLKKLCCPFCFRCDCKNGQLCGAFVKIDQKRFQFGDDFPGDARKQASETTKFANSLKGKFCPIHKDFHILHPCDDDAVVPCLAVNGQKTI